MLHWIYILITLVVLILVTQELFHEKRWREQAALALIVLPLLMRVLHLK